jgi:aminoglycoside 6'-N-acetyltransferase
VARDDVTIAGGRVVLRPADLADADTFLHVLLAPEVARWWPNESRDSVHRHITGEDVHTFAVVHEDRVVGLIQYWEEPEPEYRHAGIDIALGPEAHGRGLGTDAVAAMAHFLVRERGHHRVTIDPAADNTRAIHCYEKVGFRPVGVMREYERGADGTFHDGLLMDLLARELDD